MSTAASNSALQPLERFVGTWSTEATHPSLPGVVVRGTVVVEWLEGNRFLIHRARSDHPDFPDSISILGATDQDRVDDATGDTSASRQPRLTMHYFDSRGVFRVYDLSADAEALRFSRSAPAFSQRFTGTFADGGDTIVGRWQLSRDDLSWDDDLSITYRRSPNARE
jgi:hypothetical protein